MGRIIEFYVPEDHKPKLRWAPVENGRLIEFPSSKAEDYRQLTWIFPEVDADLA